MKKVECIVRPHLLEAVKTKNDAIEWASPTQSVTNRPPCAMVNIPCAITSGSPTDLATCSFQWIGLKSPEAPAYITRLSRSTG